MSVHVDESGAEYLPRSVDGPGGLAEPGPDAGYPPVHDGCVGPEELPACSVRHQRSGDENVKHNRSSGQSFH